MKKSLYSRFKRLCDIGFALFNLLLFSVPMLIIMLLIVLDSPGASPIFAQQRVGKNGKLFTMYKFRSMCPNAEELRKELEQYNEMDGPVFKIKNDPRITRFGRFLRKSSLDELPQLWNVLRGEMSAVDPRPAMPDEAAKYDQRAKRRLSIKPGMTCYWQVQPKKNSLSFEDWLRWDLKYLRERSFSVDCKILLSTVGAVLSMNGE